jgi:two-component system, OmpR family, phosphate regulon sensor histidine kinase PhoR
MKTISALNRKWLLYTFSFFIFFSFVLILIEYRHEKSIRTDSLDKRLNDYNIIVNNFLVENDITTSGNYYRLDSLVRFLPDTSLRITVIGSDGRVYFDSWVRDIQSMDNHLSRPEILQALNEGTGNAIRLSASTHVKYYYFARYYGSYFIRSSLVYDINIRQVLKPDLLFLFFMVLMLFTTSFTVLFISDKFRESLDTLRKFTASVFENRPVDTEASFPRNELGEIGKKIIEIYSSLTRTKEELMSERSKLVRHLNMLEEGIAIFSPDKKITTKNNHFILFISHISSKKIYSAEDVFAIPEFLPLNEFIKRNTNRKTKGMPADQLSYEISISSEGRHFIARAITFEDGSFEYSIRDVTKPEKRKLLKQELTENIAHELKTPVSSIRGLLETVLESRPDPEKTADFLRRAYAQACRLTELIDDISMLTKIEEAAKLYQIEAVNISNIISEVTLELQAGIKAKKIIIRQNVDKDINMRGNPVLLYSIFRNLIDNVINYCGIGTTIVIEKFMEDEEDYYFSFSDNGQGVPEQDLPRLFERFYRVDRGRDRKKGGTGLGLAIVKNAINFHRGTVNVKNAPGGGLIFTFTISKLL